jgi:hypothetical protein
MIEDFYNQVFVCGQSSITRGELESLPCPFKTFGIDDTTMQKVVECTEEATREDLRLSKEEKIDFNNDKHSECWWKNLEHFCNHFNIPYYEDEP